MGKPKANGCLSVFFKGLVIIFLIGNVYAVVRMEWARIQVYRLAHQLDYTAANYLYSTFEDGGANLVTGGAERYVVLYYTTQMTAVTYRERLAQIDPKVFDADIMGKAYVGREVGINLLPRSDGNLDQPQARRAIQPPSPNRWLIPSDYDVSIEFQTLSPQEYRVEYKGQPITGNLAKISVSGGIIEPWFMVGVLLWEKVHFFGL